jgi:APA family basic amino acid/polyamine antiporter
MKLVISLSSDPKGFGFLQVFPVVQSLPAWVGPGGLELLGGVLSINVLAPLFLVALTVILCQGVRESSIINDVMTVTKVDQCFPQLTSDFLHFLELGCF